MTTAVTNINSQVTAEHSNFFNGDIVGKWIAYAQVKPSSVKSYTKGIRRLAEFYSANSITELSREFILNYREYLKTKYAAATANLYLTAAKLFISFLQVEGFIGNNPADRVKGLKVVAGHKKDALSADSVKKILASFDTETVKGKRDKAMFALMTTAGLRTIEVARANIGDIVSRDGKYFLYVQGKGRDEKDAAVNVTSGVYQLIQNYLADRADVSDSAPLFASLSNRSLGRAMTTNSISRIIKTAFRRAGFDSKRLTAHSLRHTAATAALKAGATLRQVQQVLRHTNIAVTQIYLHELDRFDNNAETLAAASFGI